MADDEPPPSSEPVPVPAAAEPLSAVSTGSAPAPSLPDGSSVINQPPIERINRRIEQTPRVWWRPWAAAGGLVVSAACLHGLLGGAWPAWKLPLPREGRTPGVVAVVIDPGHGGGDTGAVAQGVVEKDLNLDVGRRVAQALVSRGIRVLLTREDDHFVTLEDRVRTANTQPGAVFVSIHFNDASGDGRVAMNRASGIETYYSENKAMSASVGGWMWASLYGAGAKANPAAARDVLAWSVHESALLAQSIQGALVASTSAADRGIKERALYVTRRVRGPAVLVEGGFVSHPAEARRLGDAAYRQTLADSIADGIVKYLDAPSRQPVPAAVATAPLGV